MELPKYMQAMEATAALTKLRNIEVELPLLKTKAIVTPLMNIDDAQLKSLYSTGATFLTTFNRILFEHVTFSDIKFESFDDFQMHLNPADKSLLVYALLTCSFTELAEKEFTCPNCNKTYVKALDPSSMYKVDAQPKKWQFKEDFLTYSKTVKINDWLQIDYKMPNELDKLKLVALFNEQEMKDNVQDNGGILNNMAMLALYIREVRIKGENEEPIILNDIMTEIYPWLNSTPIDLKTKIIKTNETKLFDPFMPKFEYKLVCDHCKDQHTWEGVDPEEDFFRQILFIYE